MKPLKNQGLFRADSYINKKDLLGEELLSLINCISDEDQDVIPESFFGSSRIAVESLAWGTDKY